MIQLPINIDFSGKVVVVTGAGGLICGAMARAFAQSGAKVAALDLNEDAVKKLAVILKLAESLDVTGFARIMDISCDILGDSVIMKTITKAEVPLEIMQAKLASNEFKKAYNKNLEIL